MLSHTTNTSSSTPDNKCDGDMVKATANALMDFASISAACSSAASSVNSSDSIATKNENENEEKEADGYNGHHDKKNTILPSMVGFKHQKFPLKVSNSC